MGFLPQIKVLHYFYSISKRKKIVAHCLNFDLVTSADTIEEAEKRLDVVVRFHIERFLRTCGQSGLNDPAPNAQWEKYIYSLRHGGARPSEPLRINVPNVVPMAMPYGDVEIVSAQAA